MLKFLVLGLFMCHQVVNDVCGQTRADGADTEGPSFFTIASSPNNDSSQISTPQTGVQYSFHATQQFFYLQGPFPWQSSSSSTKKLQNNVRKFPADYVVTDGMGAHKLHTRELTWNEARKTCVEEGGHLTDIRTLEEHKVIFKLMTDKSVKDTWVGYHDKFEKGYWVSMLEEAVDQSLWSGIVTPYPDLDMVDCASLEVGTGGLYGVPCNWEKPFVCKIWNVQGSDKK